MASNDSDKGLTPDELLQNPGVVKASERERLMYARRKAKEEAERARKLASKRKTPPKAEDMIADLQRVAEDPDLNPYHKWKTLTEKRYDEYGYYPLEMLQSHEGWGEFHHCLEIAGLRKKKGDRDTLAARANASRVMHASRYIEEVCAPHFVDEPWLERDVDGVKLMLTISDLHSMYLCPWSFFAFLKDCEYRQPDIVCINGDAADMPGVSRHPKIPGWTPPLQLEFDFFREIVRMIREVCPHALIVVTGGNHDLDRWAAYLTQTAPAIAELDTMRFDVQLGLDEYGVKLAMGGKFISPRGQEDNPPGFELFGGIFQVYHGTCLGENAQRKELLAHPGQWGTSGHTHHPGIQHLHNYTWMSTGMMCTHKAGRGYMPKSKTGWMRAYGETYFAARADKKTDVQQSFIVTEGETCMAGGRLIRPTPAIKKLKNDPMKNWLKGVTL